MEDKNLTEEEKQSLLDDILANSKDEVKIGRHTIKMGWVRHSARRKVSHILSKEKDETKVVAKCVAALILNHRVLIFLFYWFLWRWIYYVEEFTEEELLPFISVCKKKADALSYFVCMAYLTDMRDTTEKMTREDAKHILQARK